MSDHVENGIRQNESSDKLIFSRIIKVQKLIMGGNTINFRLLVGGNVDNTVDYHTAECDILHWFVGFLLKQYDIFLTVFKETDGLSVPEGENFFCREIEFIKVLIGLKVALFGLIV